MVYCSNCPTSRCWRGWGCYWEGSPSQGGVGVEGRAKLRSGCVANMRWDEYDHSSCIDASSEPHLLGAFCVCARRGKIVDAAFHVVEATVEATGESFDIRTEAFGDLVVKSFLRRGITTGFVHWIFAGVAHGRCGKWCCVPAIGSVVV